MFYSDDDGDTWNTPTSSGIASSADINSIGYDGSGVLMATSELNNGGNLLRSVDNGLNWTTASTGLPTNYSFRDIKYDSTASVWILAGFSPTVGRTESNIWTSPDGLAPWTEQVGTSGPGGDNQGLQVIGGKSIVGPS